MGTLTADDMLTEIAETLGKKTSLSASSSRVLNALNLAQEELATIKNWQELESTETFTMTASQPYTLFSSISASFNPKEIYTVRIIDPSDRSNSRKLSQRLTRQYDQTIADSQFYGEREPKTFIRWNNQFEWFATPDQNYPCTIRVYNWPSILTAGNGKSDFDHKDRALIHLACNFLLMSEGEEERAKFHWTAVYGRNGIIDKLLTEDSDDPDIEVVGQADPHGRQRAVSDAGEYWRNPLISRT